MEGRPCRQLTADLNEVVPADLQLEGSLKGDLLLVVLPPVDFVVLHNSLSNSSLKNKETTNRIYQKLES